MDREELRAIWTDAVAKTAAGDWAGATTGFSRVYEEMSGAQKARAAYNMGICWSKQNNNEGAMSWLGEYLGMPESHDQRRTSVLESFWKAWKGHQTDLELFTTAE